MPGYSGAAALPGLSAEARVYRDRWGVPHIFAANKNDAARALGYIHASERLFQMDMQRRAGQGRLSEMAGPGMLGTDKYIRRSGFTAFRRAASPRCRRRSSLICRLMPMGLMRGWPRMKAVCRLSSC